MSIHIRRTLPLAIAGISGFLMVLEYALLIKEVSVVGTAIREFTMIIAGLAICLGAANIVAMHGRTLVKRSSKNWQYSAILLFTMFLYIVIGLTLKTTSLPYSWLYNTFNLPLAQAMSCLLAFYLFSAAVRAFQARTLEASIFLTCGVLVVIANIPSIASVLPQLTAAGSWVNDVPTKGAYRGLIIAAAVGAIILSLRTLMGREAAYLGRA